VGQCRLLVEIEAERETCGVSIKTLSSRVVHENPWLSLREDRIERVDGSHGLYSVIDKPDFALVIPWKTTGSTSSSSTGTRSRADPGSSRPVPFRKGQPAPQRKWPPLN
jgi:hypothetical protein